MKIVIDSDIPFIRNCFDEGVNTVYLPAKEFSKENVKDADALIVRTRTICDSRLLENSGVKVIATATIGTDHIDIPWCEKNGITVKSAPGCNAPGVAQYVFSSLFNAGFDPETQTLGIIGYGNVGHIVGEWAEKMGIQTLISDAPREKAGFRDVDYRAMEEVLRNSDAVTVHVPLTKIGEYPTFHLLGKSELDLMKPKAFLVNTSRGGVVDESSLIQKLREGKLRAIVDVWENEPSVNKELLSLAAIATPHIAGYSFEGKKRATKMAAEGVAGVLGINVNLEDLDCVPSGNIEISRELILDSYDPRKETARLVANPDRFESQRNSYVYRHEPLFL